MNWKSITALFAVALCLFTGLAQADNDYMVENGDSLSKIGALFSVPYKEIMKANHLTSTVIHPDQILRIPSAGRSTDRELAMMAKMAEDEAEASKNQPTKAEPVLIAKTKLPGYSDITPVTRPASTRPAYVPPVQGASKARPRTPPAPETYIVREGDTLYNISRRFGVGAVELKKANNIKYSNIQIGQVLTLPNKVSIAAAN